MVPEENDSLIRGITMFNRIALAIALLTIGTSVSASESSMRPSQYLLAQAQLQDATKGQCYQGCQKVYNGCEPKVQYGTCSQNLSKCTAACDAPK